MKFAIISLRLVFLFSIIAGYNSCKGQTQKPSDKEIESSAKWLSGDTVSTIDGEIRGITQDAKGNVWFASNGKGVYKYDGKTIINFTEKHGLSSNYTWMVKEGKDGNIWFKTQDRAKATDAICFFNGYAFKTLQPDTNLKTYNLKTGDFLFDYYYDGKSLAKIQLPHTSPIINNLNQRHHYDIYTTCLDKNGNAWFGTGSAGICKYDGKNYTWFDNKELGAAIRDIYEDKNGTIWAGNNGDGLFKYNGKNFINFSKEKNLHNPVFERYPTGKPGLMSRVWKINEDKQGNLCLATIDNGLWVYDGKKFTNYRSEEGLPIDAIWTIFKDKTGNLWVGTEGAGAYTFNGKSFTKFAQK